ncbi:hypothetical protein [Streptomyces sp. NBC_00503]|nr:hypothetical protein [Streptomyces sp. NBC_00503]WUD79135.1 hypothetical protein OG490_00190 [Streptomyces sp. NBC_00503]
MRRAVHRRRQGKEAELGEHSVGLAWALGAGAAAPGPHTGV